jgi:hypothetical protein
MLTHFAAPSKERSAAAQAPHSAYVRFLTFPATRSATLEGQLSVEGDPR